MNERNYTTAAERERQRDEDLRAIRQELAALTLSMDTLLLSLNMRCPDFAPVERDPWETEEQEVSS